MPLGPGEGMYATRKDACDEITAGVILKTSAPCYLDYSWPHRAFLFPSLSLGRSCGDQGTPGRNQLSLLCGDWGVRLTVLGSSSGSAALCLHVSLYLCVCVCPCVCMHMVLSLCLMWLCVCLRMALCLSLHVAVSVCTQLCLCLM